MRVKTRPINFNTNRLDQMANKQENKKVAN